MSNLRIQLPGLVWLALALAPPVLADAVHIRNTDPAAPRRTVHLQELWRVGGDEGDVLFGTVTESVTDTDGNVYLLDNQLCHVEVFSPEGEYVATLGREGDGPGEVRLPRDVVMLADGTVGIATLFPSKLVRLTRDGEPQPSFTMGGDGGPATGFYVTIGCEQRAGTLLLAGQHSVPSDAGQDRTQFLSSVAATGEEIARLLEARTVMDFQGARIVEKELMPGFFIANAIGPDGLIYAARSRDEYVIDVYRSDGTLERTIEREFSNRPRTPRETRRIQAIFAAATRQMVGDFTQTIEPANPVIAGLFVDAKGNLWVKHSRSGDDRPPGILQTYDLFDREGRYVQEVSVACEGDPAYDDLEFLPDGRVLLIKGYVLAQWSAFDFGTVAWDEEEEVSPLEVVCCRMSD